MADPKKALDLAFEALKEGTINALVSNAVDANIAGQIKATKQLRAPLSFNLINSRAVEATKDYRESLIRFGGSDIVNVDTNGMARKEFKPWLSDAIESDRDRVGTIISDAIKNGTPRRDVVKQLDTVFTEREHNSELTAFQEMKKIYREASDARFDEENIQRFTWYHLPGQLDPREEHESLDGREFDADDPIWLLQLEYNCHCDKVPVLSGRV